MIYYADNDTLRGAILRVMRDGRPRTKSTIARELDTTGSRIRFTLQRMVADGELQQLTAYGHVATRYQATSKARA